MIIQWDTLLYGGNTYPQYPNPNQVLIGVVYAYGAMIGTYDPTAYWTALPPDEVALGVHYKVNSLTNNRIGTLAGNCDYPNEDNVRSGIEYDNGDLVGTLKVNPSQTNVIWNNNQNLLNFDSGTMPNMSGAIDQWMQKMVFTIVEKTMINYQIYESGTDYNFQGVWQPFTIQQLMLKPTGERDWKWFMLHTQIGVGLSPDMVVTYLGTQYRVKEKLDYTLDGYLEYHLIQDYVGSGPQAAT